MPWGPERALAASPDARRAPKGRVAGTANPPYVVTAKQRSSMAKVSLGNWHWHLPQSRPLRIGIGILLIGGGLLGFLPILGFWMIPLGLLVLSVDIPIVRRWRRQLAVWWHRDRKEEDGVAATGPAEREQDTKI
jgi:hypothetical protein